MKILVFVQRVCEAIRAAHVKAIASATNIKTIPQPSLTSPPPPNYSGGSLVPVQVRWSLREPPKASPPSPQYRHCLYYPIASVSPLKQPLAVSLWICNLAWLWAIVAGEKSDRPTITPHPKPFFEPQNGSAIRRGLLICW